MSNFIENGKCVYSLVIPENATKEEKFALSELCMILEKACGEKPSVVEDKEDLPNRCVHIGDTLLAQKLGIKPSVEEASSDGYSLKKRGDNFFISSCGKEGVIYGVYGYAREYLGAEFFGYLAWDIPKVETAVFPEKDVVIKPAFDRRARSMSWQEYDLDTERRFGFDLGDGIDWIEFEHSHFRLLPKEKYMEKHPDWYTPGGEQLCLTNPEMREEMKKVVLSRLTPEVFARGDMFGFNIGHEDNSVFCSCPRCEEEKKKYGGNSGVNMRFINEMADAINDFVEKNYPNKQVKIVTFGYGPTFIPPVVKDENGQLKPAHESVIAHKNVGIFFAPLGPNWAYSMLDEEKNAEFAMSMNGWRTIQTEMFVWTYDGIFYAGNIPMDNWEYLKESYVNFKNCGAAYLFDQYNGTNFDFDMMRHYVRGRLMWDLSLDQEELVRHFMKHYYKEAWEKVYEYFNFFRAHTKQLEKELESKGEILDIRSFTRYNKKMAERDYWDRDYLVKSYEILNEARELTSPVSKGWRDTRFRVEMEMVTPIYLLMTLYPDTLSTEFMKEVVATYERVLTETGQITCGKYGLYFKVLSDFRAMLIDREANA